MTGLRYRTFSGAFYDRYLIAFSGGKDSLACILDALDAGVPAERIELHHHDVDGGGASHLMDWPVTPAYCRAVAAHLGLKLMFSHKVGGFEREMLRTDQLTAPMRWQRPDGSWRQSGGVTGKRSTRRRFPQVSADLSVRWCSAYLKIDVMSAMIRNEPRFSRGRTLVITGERAEESEARAGYAEFEPDRSDNRDGVRTYRWVDRFRPVLKWSQAEVWAIIKRWRIIPHPAYQLGWGRLSCRACIFGSAHQWATVKRHYPAQFAAVAGYEDAFGATIQRSASVRQLAAKGVAYAAAEARAALVREADETEWSGPVTTDDWQLPAGAFGENAGPT